MELLIMILAPLPIGYLIRNKTAAYVSYLALYSFVFTFQSMYLVLEWVGGSTAAFGPTPHANDAYIWAYAAVNLGVLAVALGLVALGQHLQARRSRRAQAVSLDSVAA